MGKDSRLYVIAVKTKKEESAVQCYLIMSCFSLLARARTGFVQHELGDAHCEYDQEKGMTVRRRRRRRRDKNESIHCDAKVDLGNSAKVKLSNGARWKWKGRPPGAKVRAPPSWHRFGHADHQCLSC